MLGQTDVPDFGDFQASLNHFHQYIKERNRCLLVIDNADDVENAIRCLPHETVCCHILVTTRSSVQPHFSNIPVSPNIVHLESLSEAVATAALISGSGRNSQNMSLSERDNAAAIASLPPVEGLPIAISHASTFIREKDLSFEEYRCMLLEKKKNLPVDLDLTTFLRYFCLSHIEEKLRRLGIKKPRDLEKLKPDSFSLTLSFDKESLAFAIERLHSTRHAFLTWEMNIEEISKSHPEGETVLFCCSVLNSKGIPQLIITDFLRTAHGTSATWRFRAGVSAVQKYSLLRELVLNDGSTYYDVHHLVHRSIYERLRQKPETLKFVLTTVGECVVSMLRPALDDQNLRQFCLLLSPHLAEIAKKILLVEGNLTDQLWQIVDCACLMHLHLHQLKTLKALGLNAAEKVKDVTSQQTKGYLTTKCELWSK